jgi:hypothetical protein
MHHHTITILEKNIAIFGIFARAWPYIAILIAMHVTFRLAWHLRYAILKKIVVIADRAIASQESFSDPINLVS